MTTTEKPTNGDRCEVSPNRRHRDEWDDFLEARVCKWCGVEMTLFGPGDGTRYESTSAYGATQVTGGSAILADLFGICPTCTPIWTTWHRLEGSAAGIRRRAGAHLAQIGRGCRERQRLGRPCATPGTP